MALGRASADKLAPDEKAKALGLVLKQVSSLLWASVFSMHRNHACLCAGLSHRNPHVELFACVQDKLWSEVFMWA